MKINDVFRNGDSGERPSIELFGTLITNHLTRVEIETQGRRPRDLSCYPEYVDKISLKTIGVRSEWTCYPEFVDEILAGTDVFYSDWMNGMWFFIIIPVCPLTM